MKYDIKNKYIYNTHCSFSQYCDRSENVAQKGKIFSTENFNLQ